MTTIELEYEDEEEEAKLQEYLDLCSIDHIQEVLLKGPSYMAYFSARAVDAGNIFRRAKKNAERAKSVVYIRLRDEGSRSGKKLTEATIDAQIRVDPEFIEFQNQELVAEERLSRAKYRSETVKAAQSNMMTLASMLKEEIKSEGYIRD